MALHTKLDFDIQLDRRLQGLSSKHEASTATFSAPEASMKQVQLLLVRVSH